MRILFAVHGSSGDLNPRLAIAAELQRRGHSITFATHILHEQTVRAAGLSFRNLRPQALGYDKSRLISGYQSVEDGLRFQLKTTLNDTFDDLIAYASDADAMLSSDVVVAAGLAAFATGVRWIDTIASPGMSSSVAATSMSRWSAPWVRDRARALSSLCRERGLASAAIYFKPTSKLGLFSPAMLEPSASETGSAVHAVGFPFYESGATRLDPRLEEYLNAGEPPIVFAFGSSSPFAVEILHPVSIAAAVRLGVRAVVLTGSSDLTMPGSGTNDDKVFVGGFAPYNALFPRARVVIHHGGIGTIARTLLAGKPMIVTPFFTDQPANAVLAQRWGVGRILPPENYRVESLVHEIDQVLGNPDYAQRARQFSEVLLKEDGVATASDVIERLASATDDGLVGPASRNQRRH